MGSVCLDQVFAAYCFYIFINVFLLLTSVAGIYKYFGKKDKTKSSQRLILTEAIYLFMSIVTLIQFLIYGIYIIITCNNRTNTVYQYLKTINNVLYWIQTYGLWLILFLRLFYVFNKSVYALSCCTLIIYGFILTVFPIGVIASFLPIWPSNDASNPETLLFNVISTLYTSSMLFCVSITILFLYKLRKVYKNVTDAKSNHDFISITTRNTILSSISVLFTAFAVSAVASATRGRILLIIISDFMFLFDIYSNIICTLLTYTIFEKEYNKYCKCLDLKCRSCCKSFLSTPTEIQLASSMSSVSSIDQTKSEETETQSI